MIETNISKEHFLAEHNRLSPENLQATFAMLTRFQEEKKPLLQDSEWSFKLRMPFISWLLLAPRGLADKTISTRRSSKQEYHIYPKPE